MSAGNYHRGQRSPTMGRLPFLLLHTGGAAKVVMQQVRRNVAHRPARTHRGRSSFRFVKIPKQLNQKVTLMAKGGCTSISGPSCDSITTI
jgi:hypothetical protein